MGRKRTPNLGRIEGWFFEFKSQVESYLGKAA